MIQIRNGVFETNSSSTHSLVMCMKNDYDKWANREVYLNNEAGWSSYSEYKNKQFVTKEEAIDIITNNAPVMMLISTSILAPFVEESIFRLGLRSVIKEKYLFIAISGLVFGFMHIFPTELPLYVALIQSIVYVAMGICLAYMYTETDKFWITIIIHALNNFLSMAAILIF